jgi:hypothetical protein
MASLDLSLGWVGGDVERILLALGVGFSRYTLNEMTIGCNELGAIASTQVTVVRVLLGEYDTAMLHQKKAGHEDEAGKMLVKADVLEFEKENGGKYATILKEKARIVGELQKVFAFSNIIGSSTGNIGSVTYRS